MDGDCAPSSTAYLLLNTVYPPVWPSPRSLATTSGISVDVFSSSYLDVSVQTVPHVHLCIQYTLTRYCRAGFPHSEISGSMRMCRSPKLIAACHVLRRLLMPRHSPCALFCLTFRRIRLAPRRSPILLFPREPACAGLRSEIRGMENDSLASSNVKQSFAVLSIKNYAGFQRSFFAYKIVTHFLFHN